MYTRCLFCAGGLGRNEALEAFPVGRRLAYDPARGRLWVVCPQCTRWNLTPLEERWEAIEQAERLFRGARVRASTENVGLARVTGRAELVRVGRPSLPEFVSWRYAEAFERRRRQTLVQRGVGLALTTGAGLYTINALVGGSLTALFAAKWLWDAFNDDYDPDRERAAAEAADDEFVTQVVITRCPVNIRRSAIRRAVLHHDGEALALSFPFGRGTRTLVGDRAQRATATMLTHLNAAGAPREFVGRALDRLVAAGSAEAFLTQVSRRAADARTPSDMPAGLSIGIASAQTRLALEIALNEETERQALEGALAALEQAWREAEEIAAIADALAVPGGVERAFARLRGRCAERGG